MNQRVNNLLDVNRNSFSDEGEGVISFPNGLTISDDQYQRNGTRYDIETLDITKYAGQLTADHKDELRDIIGRVEGVKKANGRLTVDKIVYAVKQNPYARLAYDLLVNGFSNAFSTETIGPAANSTDSVFYNHELVGLSQVVTPNNYSATINKVVHNSLQKAMDDGLDVEGIENKFLEQFNQEEEMVTENKAEVEEKIEEAPAETDRSGKIGELINKALSELEAYLEVKGEDEVRKQLENMPEADFERIYDKYTAEEETPAEPEEEENSADVEEQVVEEVENAVEPIEVEEIVADEEPQVAEEESEDEEVIDEIKELQDRIEKLTEVIVAISDVDKDEETAELIVEDETTNAVEEEIKETNKEEISEMTKEEIQNAIAESLKGYFNSAAAEPEFVKAENSVADLDWKERYGKQVNAAYDAFRLGNIKAREVLNQINEVNFNALKEAGIAKNSMTIASMGNFVLPPEMHREIVGKRTDYSAILEATDWRETDSLEFAWLKRSGDINMQNVAMCDDGEDGNLKPISEYTATPETSKLEELAAVTVVCNAATRFFAVDLLADVAAGYRNDYDRKRAQLVIARLEQAVDESGQSVAYAPTADTEAMIKWLDAISAISDTSVNGTLVFNNKTFATLKAHALEAGVAGPLSEIFTTGDIPRIFGTPYIVVPNDLMPSIEGTDTVSFTVGGESVSIDHAVFYADLGEFVGYTSGGLQYDISADASYEVEGVVKSAYQRNELVLRGSFFRGGAIKDVTRISGIEAKARA